MLTNPQAFFNTVRSTKLLGDTLSPQEVEGLNVIIDAAVAARWPISHVAYALATAYHETAHTMVPVTEYGGPAYFMRMYDITGNRPKVAQQLGNTVPGDGARFCGRGFVQITGRANYQAFDGLLSRAGLIKPGHLMSNPDLAKNPTIAAFILRVGMTDGIFTKVKLGMVLPGPSAAVYGSFRGARRIINGMDRADDIANYAMSFQAALQAGGWR